MGLAEPPYSYLFLYVKKLDIIRPMKSLKTPGISPQFDESVGKVSLAKQMKSEQHQTAWSSCQRSFKQRKVLSPFN